MDFEKYYEARDIVTEIVRKDLLGPVEENEIICGERPLDYYILGKLYPKDTSGSDTTTSTDDCGNLDEEEGISLSNGRYPSSFGLSFSLNADVAEITVKPEASRYDLIPVEEAQHELGFEDGKYTDKTSFWKRTVLDLPEQVIDINELKQKRTKKNPLAKNLYLHIHLHKLYDEDGSMTVSVSMINDAAGTNDFTDDCKLSFFQPKLTVTSSSNDAFRDVRRNIESSKDPETAELEMLYSKIHKYASGHGCATNWKLRDDKTVESVYSEFLPQYEVLQMMPSEKSCGRIFEMKYLSEADKKEVISGISAFLSMYEDWIKDREKEKSQPPYAGFSEAADTNIEKCRNTLATLKRSLKALDDDPVVYRAFALANKAMFMQRKKGLEISKKYTCDEDIKWYPFQLAFFLQEVISFAEPYSPERQNVDLLWFPTGGGKTEAYLGIAAFSMFLRRLRNPDKSDGIAVLMRYTLRLLTFQQMERAAAMICACELLRRDEKEGIPGKEFGIGLWVGRAMTPNYIADADDVLSKGSDPHEKGEPVQFKKCPYCREKITGENYHCDLNRKRMTIKCSNPKCEFKNGLPIYLIDEEIYEHTPDFLIATIDKYAQITLNSNTSALFGKSKGHMPPELIIQDELHLISGPLGTISGVYEAAIRKLCEHDGVLPKTVASTATIKNAKEQIKSLYASKHTQFPPQGLCIDDSFFAVQSSRKEKPGRLYLGCMGIGTSPTTMMIRAMSAVLYGTRYLAENEAYSDELIDAFWTETGYFNTLRELGGALIRVVDDIQDRYNYLRTSKFEKLYPIAAERTRYDIYKELTSREDNKNIGSVIQDELSIQFKRVKETDEPLPYDFILSSNMISVGVDVDRLCVMVVDGQPKTTSEYIQATSRVGRRTPGFVLTLYNQSKSRDRSHYEDFTKYHSTFYRYVEATSVTPFSDRARDRALQALYVTLCRNMIPKLAGDEDAINYNPDDPALEEVRQYIFDCVKAVDPGELENVKRDLEEIENTWKNKVARKTKMKYRLLKGDSPSDTLFDPDYKESSRFRVMNTMRSVETTVKLTTVDNW